jgi:conserved oligomeric Golgi complex subunit 2
MSRFYFDGDSGSISSADDEDNLPYPEALPRSDFLAPDFDAPTYLSTLSERHQTLEDLRSDLRERSQALSKELLDLVNVNYEQFLGLGSDLRGGEERVEDVRMGLLGFKRGVEEVRSKVWERGWEVDRLLEGKTRVSKQVNVGRKLLEADARLDELEEKLMVSSLGRSEITAGDETWSASEDEDEEDEEVAEERGTGTTTKKLQSLVNDYRQVEHIQSTIGSHHPYIIAQEARMIRVRNTLLLDLSTALKQVYPANNASKSRLLSILKIYSQMDESAEAIKVLKTLRAGENGNSFAHSYSVGVIGT